MLSNLLSVAENLRFFNHISTAYVAGLHPGLFEEGPVKKGVLAISSKWRFTRDSIARSRNLSAQRFLPGQD
jgi:hypothetical protein